jgi:hypothetical protein
VSTAYYEELSADEDPIVGDFLFGKLPLPYPSNTGWQKKR